MPMPQSSQAQRAAIEAALREAGALTDARPSPVAIN